MEPYLKRNIGNYLGFYSMVSVQGLLDLWTYDYGGFLKGSCKGSAGGSIGFVGVQDLGCS